jgi:hypothetical protein
LTPSTESAAQVTQAEPEQLELLEGQIVYVRPSRTTVFSEAATLPDPSVTAEI